MAQRTLSHGDRPFQAPSRRALTPSSSAPHHFHGWNREFSHLSERPAKHW